MTIRAKYLLAIPAAILLVVLLLLYRLPDITAFMVERELRTAGFTDVRLDIESISPGQGMISTLRASHPAFTLRADDITLHYSLTDLLNARIDELDIALLKLSIPEQDGVPGAAALPVMPKNWLSAVPFRRAHIKRVQLELPEIAGVTKLDLQATLIRGNHTLDSEIIINTRERPPLHFHLVANDDQSLSLKMRDQASTLPAITLHSRGLTVTPGNVSTDFMIDANLVALRPLLTAWLTGQSLPELFDAIHSEGKLDYHVADKRLQSDLDIRMSGKEQTLSGPVAVTYQQGQLALLLKESFTIEAHKQVIAQAALPELQLSVKDSINCNYTPLSTAWQCGSALLSLALPEIQYPPYTMRSETGRLTLHDLHGEHDVWQADVGFDLPNVKLVLVNNVIRLDRLQARLQASPEELTTTASLHAADNKFVVSIKASHDLQHKRGKAVIDLPGISLVATDDIPGKLLRHWPYPVHIESGTLTGQSHINWRQKKSRLVLDQSAQLQLENIQGRFQKYPFSGLQGKLSIKGIDSLRISTSRELRLASIDPGLPITDILLRAEVKRSAGKAFSTTLQQFEATTLGGKVSADPTTLDFGRNENPLTLNVQGLDIAELIKLEQKKGLYGTGKLNGSLPLTLTKNGLSMKAGTLVAQAPYGVIRYSGDERLTALAQSNPNVDLLVKALSDFRYNMLEAGLDYAPDGQLLAKVRLQGKNPELEGGRPVHLNINLEENILTLLRSLQFAEDISRKIGEGIEKGGQRP